MILTCPSCATRFSVPDDAIGDAGRAVRCSACRHQWFEGPAAGDGAPGASDEAEAGTDFDQLIETGPAADDTAADAVEDGAPPEPEPEPEPSMPALSAPAAIRGSQRASRWPGVTAMASVMIAVVALAALLADDVIDVWPPSKRLYAMVGLPFAGPGEGLEMRNITARIETGDGGGRLVIEGDIINVSREVKPAPMVRVVLRDAADRDIAGWQFPASETNMIPSETVSFRTSYDRPPVGATGAALGFSTAPATTVSVPEHAAAGE